MSIVNAFFGLNKIPRVMKFFEFKSFDDVNRMGGLITQIKNQVQKEGLQLTKTQQKFLDDQMEQVKIVFKKMQNKPDPDRLDTVIDKMNKGVPLNPSDQYDKSEGVLDVFQGFKPKVIQGGKSEKELLEKLNKQNKETIERIKKRKEKESDPDKKSDGGRIGFSGGGAGFAGNQMEHDDGIGSFGPGPTFKEPTIDTMPQPQLNPMMFNMPVMQRPMSQGIIGLKDGGRIGFKDGSDPKDPSRRGFLKLMGGLAAIPIIGKYFKPAAKVADKAVPVIQDGAKLGYENFMLLVDKIKRLGKTADDLATKERERVTRYDGKDGNEYELVEDLTTGNISVTKDKPGVAVYGRGTDDVQAVDVIENRSTFIYKKGEDVVNTKTGKSKRTPDEYEEVSQTSSGPEDAFDDITEIDDKAVNEVLDELKDVADIDDLTLSQYLGPGSPRSIKAGGGLAYMLGE